jgi:hypothetical protein
MTRRPSQSAAIQATLSSAPQQPTNTPQTTLWNALEESLRAQLTKHLAALIQRARKSQALMKGRPDELP